MPKSKLSEQEKEARKEQLANETKEEKFKRIAQPRLKRAIKDINRVIKMVKSSAYAYDEETATKIKEAVFDAYEKLESAIDGNTDAEEELEL